MLFRSRANLILPRLRTHFVLLSAVVGVVVIGQAPEVDALSFNITYDPNVLSSPNSTAFQSAFNYAANQFSGWFSDNITVNLTAQYGSTGLAASDTNFQNIGVGNSAFTSLKSALNTHNTTTSDSTAIASLASNPKPFGSYWLTLANAKALGLRAANDTTMDGTVIFSDAATFNYNTTTSHAAPGQ